MNTARLNQGTPLLLNAVSKHYAENIVLNQLDLHIPAGQFVAVVGRSGGGKSTLLRLLAGLETPTAGDVLAGTTPLAEIQEDTRMMFQDARLLPWKSVIDNVGLGLQGQWRDADVYKRQTEDGLRFTVELRRFRPVVIDGSVRYATVLSTLWQRELVFIKGGDHLIFNYFSTYFQVCQGNEIRCWVTDHNHVS